MTGCQVRIQTTLGATLVMAAALVAAPAALRGGPLDTRTPERLPEIDVRAPASMAAYAERLERTDIRRLLAVMRLVGLHDPGPPIRVFLVPEDSPLARETPDWVAGYTRGGDAVVLFPERATFYPHDSLPELLQHEVAHVLIGRAAGGHRVPRWFHEGVALAAERSWTLGDRARFAYEVAFGGPAPAAGIDALFDGGRGHAARAYSLSGAFVQDLLESYGPDLPARILATMKAGRAFDGAFIAVTGTSVGEASGIFWHRRRLWITWLPWVTSPGTLYAVITLLALAAAWRVRARRAARQDEDGEY